MGTKPQDLNPEMTFWGKAMFFFQALSMMARKFERVMDTLWRDLKESIDIFQFFFSGPNTDTFSGCIMWLACAGKQYNIMLFSRQKSATARLIWEVCPSRKIIIGNSTWSLMAGKNTLDSHVKNTSAVIHPLDEWPSEYSAGLTVLMGYLGVRTPGKMTRGFSNKPSPEMQVKTVVICNKKSWK